ncbi:polyamine aminopropyltransferase [Myxococcota bacterium]|nr:polyamine aminopropyltransferase [Myxococcota bacterium]MBU1899298.1 polyamine aminopropyltransferase [Myxococcota bacterium]
MPSWMDEIYEGVMRFGLKATRTLFDQRSDFQQVTLIETEGLGRALLLDGMWMTAEGDEATYHELLTHPAMLTAQAPRRVLIIGGGDGGTAREVLRHPGVERVDMVEVDGLVMEACRAHLPTIGGPAWSDPRLHLVVGDGAAFVAQAEADSYDVILVDGADPVGPAEVLFSERFYRDCARALSPRGALATQGGSPRVQRAEHLNLIGAMRGAFAQVAPYYAPVTLYPGGAWSWIWAAQAGVDRDALDAARLAVIEPDCKQYHGGAHAGLFAVIPNDILKAIR